MINILVTGSRGQVGQEILHHSTRFPKFHFEYIDLAELDITDASAVDHFFANSNFQFCINCAAYTAVDKAETNEAAATAVNVTGVRNIAKACQAHQCRLIHLSSDYVYHNDCNRPLLESDPVNPQSVYARTKLQGDLVALQELPDSLIIRTSWVYSSFGHNFVKTMLRLGRERDTLGIVFDQIGTPTYARHLAEALLQIIEQCSKDAEIEGGIYHYSNEGIGSWYDFAVAIFELEQINCSVRPIVSSEYPTPAARPSFSVLNKQKIRDAFGWSIPHWRVGLQECLKALETQAANPV